MDGILNVNKPAGWTSRQAVDAVLRHVRPAKVGHAGTLDPIATGVLVMCVGQGTRLIEHVQQMPKTYRGQFLLGRSSDSDDTEQEVRVEEERPPVTAAAVVEALPGFLGAIEQVPPAYSAVKLRGRRAYDLARAGQQVELQPRTVEIYGIDVLRCASPLLELEIRCGGGTYIRSLGRDLARAVGTTAVMTKLERTAIGSFHIDDAVAAADLTADWIAENLLPLLAAVPHMSRFVVADTELERIAHGRTIRIPEASGGKSQIAAIDANGRLRAILVPRGREWGPLRNLGSA